MEDLREKLGLIAGDKMSRKDLISIRVDKTVPSGMNVTKRVCNENCIFDHSKGIRCNDDLFMNERGSALSNEDLASYIARISEASEKKVRVHIAGDGEPTLLNNELVSFIRTLRGLDQVHSIKLTTNGTMLHLGSHSLASRLKEAGLDSINISLHTLDPETFKYITGIDALSIVLKGIDSAIASGLRTSINCVLRPQTLDELESFMDLSREKGITIKFFSALSNTDADQKEYDSLMDKITLILSGVSEEYKNYTYPYDGIVYLVKGAVIDVKDSRINRCPNFHCEYRDQCIEGCRYEARISRIGVLQPCGARKDNRLDLSKSVATREQIVGALLSGGKL